MILDEIVKKTAARVEDCKRQMPLSEIKKRAKISFNPFCFEKALRQKGMSFICEIKKASPSAGILDDEFDYIKIADEYEKSKAAALSVLTEPDYFMGNLNILSEIKNRVKIPVLQKDFIIDEYQIYQAGFYNADAVLIICSILSSEKVRKFLEISESLGMSALVETHEISEIETAISCGAKIIGVNNRNLKTMKTDLATTFNLRKYVPGEIVFVSESGIKTQTDIKMLFESGVDAALIGEVLMKNSNKENLLESLRGGICL